MWEGQNKITIESKILKLALFRSGKEFF